VHFVGGAIAVVVEVVAGLRDAGIAGGVHVAVRELYPAVPVGVALAAVVDDAITVVVDAIALLRGAGVDARVRVITVAGAAVEAVSIGVHGAARGERPVAVHVDVGAAVLDGARVDARVAVVAVTARAGGYAAVRIAISVLIVWHAGGQLVDEAVAVLVDGRAAFWGTDLHGPGVDRGVFVVAVDVPAEPVTVTIATRIRAVAVFVDPVLAGAVRWIAALDGHGAYFRVAVVAVAAADGVRHGASPPSVSVLVETWDVTIAVVWSPGLVAVLVDAVFTLLRCAGVSVLRAIATARAVGEAGVGDRITGRRRSFVAVGGD
jgi:hypothetical protein